MAEYKLTSTVDNAIEGAPNTVLARLQSRKQVGTPIPVLLVL